jgi:hypothetical protein
MIFKRTIVFLLAFVLLMTTTNFAQTSDKLPPIKYQEMTLEWGLLFSSFPRSLKIDGKKRWK